MNSLCGLRIWYHDSYSSLGRNKSCRILLQREWNLETTFTNPSGQHGVEGQNLISTKRPMSNIQSILKAVDHWWFQWASLYLNSQYSYFCIFLVSLYKFLFLFRFLTAVCRYFSTCRSDRCYRSFWSVRH